MRIICDHCGQPISGTVKRVAGNLNFHLFCTTEVSREAKQESTTISGRCQEASVSTLMESQGVVPGVFRELE